MIVDLHDQTVPAEGRDTAKIAFALIRLSAKEAFRKQGGDFNELVTYALHDFSDEDQAAIHVHTPALPVTSKIQRRRLFSKYCNYNELDDVEVQYKYKRGCLYLIANYGKGKPQIVDFTKEFFTLKPCVFDNQSHNFLPEGVREEVALLDIECQPVRLQPSRKSNLKLRKKSNLVREIARKNIANNSSSSDEQADAKKSKSSSDNDENQKPANKTTTQKSKHQGKAKTFKRKTQRRGRV